MTNVGGLGPTWGDSDRRSRNAMQMQAAVTEARQLRDSAVGAGGPARNVVSGYVSPTAVGRGSTLPALASPSVPSQTNPGGPMLPVEQLHEPDRAESPSWLAPGGPALPDPAAEVQFQLYFNRISIVFQSYSSFFAWA